MIELGRRCETGKHAIESEETIETQISNHSEDQISSIANRKKKASSDAFKDSINQFLNYWDDNMLD